MKRNQQGKQFEERRRLLKAATGVVGAVGLSHLGNYAAEAAEFLPGEIDGYADRISCAAGDEVGMCVSTTAKKYDVEVARVGAKRDVVFKKTGLTGKRFDVPADASANGCGWPVALKIPTAADWRSGYYQVILSAANGSRGEAFFVVRSPRPGKVGKILLPLCTNTYNAYNQWGGCSLYGGPLGGVTRVSFDRPYLGFAEADNFTNLYSGWRRWELPFVQWAESSGYDIEYAVNADLEEHPELLRDYRLVLSVGHDEYWSSGMRDNLERFIEKGGNAAFFSGNTCYWQVRMEDSCRALTCWKMNFQNDPAFASGDYKHLTGTWSNCLVERPENTLTGVSFTYGGYHAFASQPGDGAYTIHRPDHWIFTGTGVSRGGSLGAGDNIVGYECDGCMFTEDDGLPVCTGADGTPTSFEILGTAPAFLAFEIDHMSIGLYGVGSTKKIPQPGAAVLGSYVQGGTVVTTGSTEWVRGLQRQNKQVIRITRNILDRLANS